MKAIGLISGGLDSCVALALALEDHLDVITTLNVSYGQKHVREVKSAKHISHHYHIAEHLAIDISHLVKHIQKGSALLNPDEALPHDRRMSEMTARVPRSYVPGRNTLFLSIAQSIAEVKGADKIIVGFNAVDYSGYPDCRPIYVEAWNHLAKYATKRGYENDPIEVYAPIINMSKSTVVYHGVRLDAPLNQTWSCYEGRAKACGRCDSCIIRKNAFFDNNIVDPIEYEEVTPSAKV